MSQIRQQTSFGLPTDLEDGVPRWMPPVVGAIGYMAENHTPASSSALSSHITLGPYMGSTVEFFLSVKLNEIKSFKMTLTSEELANATDELIARLKQMVVERYVATGKMVNFYCARAFEEKTLDLEVVTLHEISQWTNNAHELYPGRNS